VDGVARFSFSLVDLTHTGERGVVGRFRLEHAIDLCTGSVEFLVDGELEDGGRTLRPDAMERGAENGCDDKWGGSHAAFSTAHPVPWFQAPFRPWGSSALSLEVLRRSGSFGVRQLRRLSVSAFGRFALCCHAPTVSFAGSLENSNAPFPSGRT